MRLWRHVESPIYLGEGVLHVDHHVKPKCRHVGRRSRLAQSRPLTHDVDRRKIAESGSAYRSGRRGVVRRLRQNSPRRGYRHVP